MTRLKTTCRTKLYLVPKLYKEQSKNNFETETPRQYNLKAQFCYIQKQNEQVPNGKQCVKMYLADRLIVKIGVLQWIVIEEIVQVVLIRCEPRIWRTLKPPPFRTSECLVEIRQRFVGWL